MYNLQKLRIQINFVRAYLFNCDSDNCRATMDKLRRHLFSRAYLYESIHQYSIADLELIKLKSFSEMLTKNIGIGREHILKCNLCSQKGFLCEVCQKPEVLYPFDVDGTFRCQKCTNIYHKSCMNENQACPKCVRIRRRLEATQEDER
jgi:pleckstrin homology domain-containing family M member 1